MFDLQRSGKNSAPSTFLLSLCFKEEYLCTIITIYTWHVKCMQQSHTAFRRHIQTHDWYRHLTACRLSLWMAAETSDSNVLYCRHHAKKRKEALRTSCLNSQKNMFLWTVTLVYPCTTLFSQFDREASRQPKLKIDKNIHSLVHFIHPHYSTLSLLLQYSSSPLLITVQQQQFTCSTLHATSHWI